MADDSEFTQPSAKEGAPTIEIEIGDEKTVEVFTVKKGEGLFYIAVLNAQRKQILAVENIGKLRLFLENLDPKPETVLQYEPAFTIPEFLEFAKFHPVLKEVDSWVPLGLFQ